jgi:hypothetical protein
MFKRMGDKFVTDFSTDFGNDWGLYVDIENTNFIFPNNHKKMREIHGIKNQSYQDYQNELSYSDDKKSIKNPSYIYLKNTYLFHIYTSAVITSGLMYLVFFGM